MSPKAPPELEIRKAVFESIGHASVCWKPDTGSAVFDSTEAEKVGMALVDKILGWLNRD